MVLISSPVRRSGSTLNLPPSISPTSSSALAPDLGAGSCVPPVIFSVFSGFESLGTNFPSTLVIISGGGASSPMLGISLEIVELVLVMCGLRGFSIWNLRYSGAVSLPRSLKGTANLDCVVDNGRMPERIAMRLDRSRTRTEDIVPILAGLKRRVAQSEGTMEVEDANGKESYCRQARLGLRRRHNKCSSLIG